MISYWFFGRWGDIDKEVIVSRTDGISRKQVVNIIAPEDEVFSSHRISIEIGYWKLVKALIVEFPRMVWQWLISIL